MLEGLSSMFMMSHLSVTLVVTRIELDDSHDSLCLVKLSCAPSLLYRGDAITPALMTETTDGSTRSGSLDFRDSFLIASAWLGTIWMNQTLL